MAVGTLVLLGMAMLTGLRVRVAVGCAVLVAMGSGDRVPVACRVGDVARSIEGCSLVVLVATGASGCPGPGRACGVEVASGALMAGVGIFGAWVAVGGECVS